MTDEKKRRIVAAAPTVRPAGAFSRDEFIAWAANYIAGELGFPHQDIAPGSGEVSLLFAKDLSIGVVANVRATSSFAGPCVRIHLSSVAPHRISRWRAGWRPKGDVPVGSTLGVRLGDRGNVMYLEYLIPNYSQNYGAALSTAKRCIDLLLATRRSGEIV